MGSKEFSQLLTNARLLGQSTNLPIVLSDFEIAKIATVILRDVDRIDLVPEIFGDAERLGEYYLIPLKWFSGKKDLGFSIEEFLLHCETAIPDFLTYFRCLCEVHKRRLKYSRILGTQAIPTMDQIAPRSLLEYGIIETPALASWLTWRKWLYDIDNRSAQETGYLFEPILAAALGGVSYGARKSPIKRKDNVTKGRQVDCIVGTDAYEFKMRVTIAASGQGRFSEEIAFAEDCRNSGFRPILVVLDPTPSSRLTDYKAAFEEVGGIFYIGNDAWAHLEEKAGKTMANFIENYVREPISNLHTQEGNLLGLSINKSDDGSSFDLILKKDNQSFSWSIDRP